MHFWGQHFWFSNVFSFHTMLCFNSCSTLDRSKIQFFTSLRFRFLILCFYWTTIWTEVKVKLQCSGRNLDSWMIVHLNPSLIKFWAVSDFRFFNFYFLLDHNFDRDFSEIAMFEVVFLTAGWFKPFQIQLLTGLQLRLHPFCVFYWTT